MKNGHRKRWAYDRRTHKWINLKKVSMFDFVNGRYDFEPDGFSVTEEILTSIRPLTERIKSLMEKG